MATTPPATPPSTPQPSQIQTRPPFIAFDPANVPPSQYVYFQDNDFIVLNLFLINPSFAIQARYRYLDTHGEVKEGTFTTPQQFASGQVQFTFQIGEGWLLSIVLQQVQLAVAGGICFGQILFTRSSVGSIITQGVIWSGFVYLNTANGWPGLPGKDISDGTGFLHPIIGTTPAAGAEINELVPTQRRWQLLSLIAFLTTSATVANRNPGFKILADSGNLEYKIHTNAAQTASTSINYILTPGQTFYNDTVGQQLIPFPALILLRGGFRIQSDTVGLQAGDQWSAPQYVVTEWGIWDL
jgi:hypothetical protein